MERKQTVAITLDSKVAEIARQLAEAENRTLSNYDNARIVIYGHIHYFTDVLQGHVRYSSSSSVGFAFDKELPKFQIADGQEGFSLIEIENDSISISNIRIGH